MKKILILISFFFVFFAQLQADYTLETGSKNLVEKYGFSTTNLDKGLTRKEFVETLYAWYKDYRQDRGLYVNYNYYNTLDNSKYFKDVDLNSEFGKKLQYLTYIGAFSKNEYFNPYLEVTQNVFFTVLKRLSIMRSLQNCITLQICEQEADYNTVFSKGVYYRYVSKILDKSLRGYYKSPQDYLNAGYKPYLATSYYFPNAGQTLNGCYAFSIRNILKYQYGIGVKVSSVESYIGKPSNRYWNYYYMDKFDDVVNVDRGYFYSLDTLMNSLQVGEPVAISYMLTYYSSKTGEYETVPHIVAAYSFDEKGIWISETVSMQRKRVAWEDVFNSNGGVRYNRIFKFYYNPKSNWDQNEVTLERQYNFLVGES